MVFLNNKTCMYHITLHENFSMICFRVRRFSQFGLNLKWYEMTKIDYSNWKIAMRNSGNPVSLKSYCSSEALVKYFV